MIYNHVVSCEYFFHLKEGRYVAFRCRRRGPEASVQPIFYCIEMAKSHGVVQDPQFTLHGLGSGKVLSSGDNQRCKCRHRLWVSVLALCSSMSFLLSLIYSLSRHRCQLWPVWASTYIISGAFTYSPQRWLSRMFSFYKGGPCSERLSNLAKPQLANCRSEIWTQQGIDTKVLVLSTSSNCLPGAQDIDDRGTSE